MNSKNDSENSMCTKYTTRVTRLTVLPEGEPIFSERATSIEIDDEAAGEFVRVSQQGGHTDAEKWVLFDRAEWPAIKGAVDQMMGYIELHKKPEPAPMVMTMPMPFPTGTAKRKRDDNGALMD